jgi:hypothetical protein
MSWSRQSFFEALGFLGAIAPVVHRRPDIRRKLVDFVEPVADDGGGGNQQGGGNSLPLLRLGQFPLLHQTGDYLDGFAQAHVIRQTAVQAQLLQVLQPGDSPLLVFPQVALEGFGVFHRLQLAFVAELCQHLGQGIVALTFHLQLFAIPLRRSA